MKISCRLLCTNKFEVHTFKDQVSLKLKTVNASKLEILQTFIVKQGYKVNAVLNTLKGIMNSIIKSAVFF